MEGKSDNKEGFKTEHIHFPRVSGYKRGSDITEGGIMEVMVYCIRLYLLRHPT